MKNPTKLLDKIYIEEGCCKKEIVHIEKTPWENFLRRDTTTPLENIFHKFEKLLQKRWIILEDNLVYDHRIRACWFGIMEEDRRNLYFPFDKSNDVKQVEKALREEYKNSELELPTEKEVRMSLTDINPNVFPFEPYRLTHNHFYSLKDIYAVVCKGNDSKTFNYNLGNRYSTYPHKVTGYSNYFAYAIPILRLRKENNFNIPNREVFFRFVAKKLIPSAFKNDEEYLSLLDTIYYDKNERRYKVRKAERVMEEETEISEEKLIEKLLNEDKIRADLAPYDLNMLKDINRGHWSLWDMDTPTDDRNKKTELKDGLVARNPASDINKGYIGIDFGTRSTVVVYQKRGEAIHPMRIGTGDIYKKVEAKDYENPTIMEFNNLKKFIEDYNSREYKPETEWNDLTISHTAYNSLKGSRSDEVNTFFSELKEWAGDKYKQLKLIDKNKYTIDLSPFLNLDNEKFNPIEVYAYYLGLYINNQYNGIFLNYILSFPVTYEKDIRKKIVESFKKGLKKSLPPQLAKSEIDKLKVEEGASEPAAYAIVALEEYFLNSEEFEKEFFDNEGEPDTDKKIFYGVFDFGGGTTDFDFGLFRFPEKNNKNEEEYDYVVEHFGADGDRYLGGENLLKLLAFEIFKKNREKLLANGIQFEKHPDRDVFAGSEALLSNSQEARKNTKILMEALRGFWENDPEKEEVYKEDTLKINLTNREGKTLTSFELEFDKEELTKILYDRIEKGVNSFFIKLKDSFKKEKERLRNIDNVNIFLAGNSSKSLILKEIFNKKIVKEEKEWKNDDELNIIESDEIFKIFEPLTTDENNIEKPTGKTGVAFGLIKGRKGGNVLVIDKNVDNEKNDIAFKFYIGKAKWKKFKNFTDDDNENNQEKLEYNKWKKFRNASVDIFEIYYTTNPLAITGKLPITDESIKKVIVELDEANEDANVYIRAVSPTEIEYIVSENEPDDNINSNEIKRIIFKD